MLSLFDDLSAREPLELGVSDFVAVLNQTLDAAYQNVVVVGELANLRVSRGKWVYFDLKDDSSSVKCFATVYHLPGPLEDGLMMRVTGTPKLHNLYGFSFNVSQMSASGEGSIKRAAALLQAKLASEGLFDESRKRPLPYPPQTIGLIASGQSAAYADFIKIMNARWGDVHIMHAEVQVQGEAAPAQIVAAISAFNSLSVAPDVLVMIRGGGSPEDLAAFSTEQVTRAVAASRVTTMVAIGHEVDVSLAELAADKRASTPSNAAELLVPDKTQVLAATHKTKHQLGGLLSSLLAAKTAQLKYAHQQLAACIQHYIDGKQQALAATQHVLHALSPNAILRRGYAVVRQNAQPKNGQSKVSKAVVITSVHQLTSGTEINMQLADGYTNATIQ